MFAVGHKRALHVICWHGIIKDSLLIRSKATKCVESSLQPRSRQWLDGESGRSSSMLPLRLLKNGSVIALVMHPQSKDDSDPDVGKRSHRNGMAFALRSFALIVLPGPCFTLRRLPGKLLQGIAQRFDTAQSPMRFGVGSTLIQHWRGASQCLQEAFILIARPVFADLCQQSWSQALASSWQAGKEIMVLMSQKKGVNLLVILRNLLNEWQQLAYQHQHQARFGVGHHRISLQLGLMQALNDLGCHMQWIGMACALEHLDDLLCRSCHRRRRRWIGLQKQQRRGLLELGEQLQSHWIIRASGKR